MLATIIRTDVAVDVSIKIMDAFVEMRKFISMNGQVFERLTNVEYKLLEHDNKFNQVFNELQNNKEKEFKQKIFFKGQIWDSYELIIDIIKMAKTKIVIVDNYIDDSILKMLQKKNKNVEVIILITNAIMCARQGNSYRGNNIDLKKSTINCCEYLKKQISIVKPKVILTLGYYSLMSLSKLFNFKIDKTLKETIKNYSEIEINNFVIIPLYHPVAQIKKEIII